MSEQESMDRLLRQAMAAVPPPVLSPGFDQRLAKRLRARRLSATGRLVLACYSLAALLVSVGTMRWASIDWSLIVVAILVPLAIVATARRRHVSPAR